MKHKLIYNNFPFTWSDVITGEIQKSKINVHSAKTEAPNDIQTRVSSIVYIQLDGVSEFRKSLITQNYQFLV